jgi:hypothetical protein
VVNVGADAGVLMVTPWVRVLVVAAPLALYPNESAPVAQAVGRYVAE